MTVGAAGMAGAGGLDVAGAAAGTAVNEACTAVCGANEKSDTVENTAVALCTGCASPCCGERNSAEALACRRTRFNKGLLEPNRFCEAILYFRRYNPTAPGRTITSPPANSKV